MMDYPKLGDCSFSRFGSIVWTDTQTDMDEHFTPATVSVGVSKNREYVECIRRY